MTRPRSRRRFLATVVPVALAGCLVEAGDEEPAESTTETTTPEDDGGSDSGAAEVNSNDSNATWTGSDAAGIQIEDVIIEGITESTLLSQIAADIVLRNPGDRTYGTIELRVDAYYEPPDVGTKTYHPPRVDERTAVGYTYVEREFREFGSETWTYEDIVIQYDADADANGSIDPDEFSLEVVVRRAEPI